MGTKFKTGGSEDHDLWSLWNSTPGFREPFCVEFLSRDTTTEMFQRARFHKAYQLMPPCDVNFFVCSYPYSEDVTDGRSYMKTRVPAWCDRILLSKSAKGLVKEVQIEGQSPRITRSVNKNVNFSSKVLANPEMPLIPNVCKQNSANYKLTL